MQTMTQVAAPQVPDILGVTAETGRRAAVGFIADLVRTLDEVLRR
jgi:hypothetical protein